MTDGFIEKKDLFFVELNVLSSILLVEIILQSSSIYVALLAAIYMSFPSAFTIIWIYDFPHYAKIYLMWYLNLSTDERVPTELKKSIMQARLDKKLTQAQLAQMINEKPQVIQEYESGKAIPNQQIITKLERALGVKLRGKKWKTMPLVNTLKKICLHYYCILWSPKTWATFEFCCSGVHEFLCLGLLLQKGVDWIWWKWLIGFGRSSWLYID